MNQNNSRRARSPPFGFHHSRPVMNNREFDNPPVYPPMNQYDSSARSQQIGMPPMHQQHQMQSLTPQMQQSFMDVGPHHDYSPNYREPQRVAINHRSTRDPYMPGPVNQLPRPNSPPYKILCITNINHKISDGPIKEALSSDFGRFGDISVSICHDSGERLAYIYFRNYEEAREARHSRMGTVFFDRTIEIEPIYEPLRGDATDGPQLNISSPNGMMPSGPPIYSPRRRSASPPNNYPNEINGPIPHRRFPPHPRAHIQHGLPPSQSVFPHHRGIPSPEYAQSNYPYALSPPPTMAPAPMPPYERRNDYNNSGFAQYPAPQIMSASSPYSSPPHEQYRPSYPPQHHPSSNYHIQNHPNHSPHQSSGPFVLPSSMSRSDRDRIPSDRNLAVRSPRNDPYYPIDHRGPPSSVPQNNHHFSSRTPAHPHHSSTAHQPSTAGHRSHPSAPHPRYHQHHQPDPPARFMSREYRREKFGGDHPPGEQDDGRPSRVLLVNNIDATKTELDIREKFESYGSIEDIEVKKVGPEISSALIKFSSMDGAYKAKTANNGRHIGNSRCRIVYGKVSASRRLWIGGLSPATTVPSLENECSKYGDIVSMEYTSGRPYSYVEYQSANQAQFAAHHLKTILTPASERKIRVEFVDPDRSDKLLPKQELNSQGPETGSKSRATNDATYSQDSSPRSLGAPAKQRRSLSPSNDMSKRVCQHNDLPIATNTFKHERLAAAAAAKARTSSTTSSLTSHPPEKCDDRTRDIGDTSELNNNSDSNQATNGNLDTKQTPNLDDISSQEAPSIEMLSQCLSVKDIVQCCSISWPGQLGLRNFTFPAQMYLCSGRKQLIDKYLSRPSDENGGIRYPLLSITQRWRLHPQPKLEEVKRRMQSGNLGILIITSRQDNLANKQASNHANDGGKQMALVGNNTNLVGSKSVKENGDADKSRTSETPQTHGLFDKAESKVAESGVGCSLDESTNSLNNSTDSAKNNSTLSNTTLNRESVAPTTQSRPLRNLISYLEQKDAAGVISLSAPDVNLDSAPPSTEGSPKLLYAFPPGDFALNLLKRRASSISSEATKEEFLLGVIVGGNVEGKIL